MQVLKWMSWDYLSPLVYHKIDKDNFNQLDDNGVPLEIGNCGFWHSMFPFWNTSSRFCPKTAGTHPRENAKTHKFMLTANVITFIELRDEIFRRNHLD